jgi:uncharacterized protein YgbK (DUF1537 family)
MHLAYYADDFTGSTDALESLARAGLRTALFLEPPSSATLTRYGEVDAIGVAGLTRSLPPDAMEAALRPAFAALKALGPRHVHYKVCSTFDSSPQVGSIGRAIEVGLDVFEQRWAPLLVGAPALGRYCVFGQLFARFGIGSAGAIHRLDRHPALRRHPVTPMLEADLLMHLAAQTPLGSALVDVLALESGVEATTASLAEHLADPAIRIVLFDGLTPAHLAQAGLLIAGAQRERGAPWFSVGSSAVGAALGTTWQTEGLFSPRTEWLSPGAVDALLVVSGSCSPVTAGQIAWAEAQGFAVLDVVPTAAAIGRVRDEAVAHLRAGRSVVICTSRGGTDTPAPASEVGSALGLLAGEVLAATRMHRLVIAGGDTSSYAGRALGIESLTMLAPLAPGAPLCLAAGERLPVSRLEVNFKGGQVGAVDFFGTVRRGQR